MEIFKNPLEIVQLIPIFSYLNILSDFLLTESHLSEIDQNKQIPIVNALYEYLQQHKNNQVKKIELIRTLLKGSDLYGEKEDEQLNEIFVNTMFDYIISSLVFHKYGNIYGFLADIFLKAENLQVDQVLDLILDELKYATFENEFGDDSVLSFLSAARIYNDIILPLFPRANAELSLLSLDYIYAQAGSMFLRPGRINTAYYFDIKTVSMPIDHNLFDQFLAIGYAIEEIILTDENSSMLKAFALPALSHYIFHSKYLVARENMTNAISDSIFWQTAYKHLFEYTADIFNHIQVELKSDYTLKLHLPLSNFQTSSQLSKTTENQTIPFYSKSPESSEYKNEDVKNYSQSRINDIVKTYEMYESKLIREAFPKLLIDKLEDNEVMIKLLLVKNDDSFESHLPFDCFEFYYPRVMSFDYYILKREDYNAILINQAYNPELFNKENRMHFDKFFSAATSRILKTTNENITEFFEKFIKYKTSRLQSYLELNNPEGDTDWWREFGLSLVPFYPCFVNTSCDGTLNKVEFFYKHENATWKIVNQTSRSLLSTVGTSIKSVFLKNATYKTVDEMTEKRQKLTLSGVLNKSEIFQDISQHISDPGFQLTFATKHQISLLKKIIKSLEDKTNLFPSIIDSLLKISILKTNSFQSVGHVGENRSRLLYVNTLPNIHDSGYGYKFVFLSDDTSKLAQLRTGYEFKDERLVSLVIISPKKYIVLNNKTLQPEPDFFMYEINHQLQRRSTRVTFAGIAIPEDDSNEKCNDNRYFEKWRNDNVCRRRERYSEKNRREQDAVKFIKKNTNLKEKKIRDTLGKYVFPDNRTLTQFVTYWLQNNSLHDTIWSRNYMMDNPNLLNKLRYDFRFENHDISHHGGGLIINHLYSATERRVIEEEASTVSIIKDYNEQNASYSVTLHDYYAIRNFVTTGYTRITRDTREAKLMRIALYKLAIRQSDDPVEKFDLKLFRVEYRPIAAFRMTPSGKYLKLTKFTTTFPNAESAVRFAGYPSPGFMNVLYEMVFEGPYLRGKIEQFYKKKEKNVILLPGSEFLVTNGTRVNIGGLGTVLKLTLKFKYSSNDKYVWYKNVMKEIARIRF